MIRQLQFVLVTALVWMLGPDQRAWATVAPERRHTDERSVSERATAQQSAMHLVTAAIQADPHGGPAARKDSWRLTHVHLQWAEQSSSHGDALRRAAVLHEYLHGRLLVGDFDPGCARLKCTLQDGRYNCLTGTILYLVLCRIAGLDADPVALPGHVNLVLHTPDGDHVIETTDRQWRPRPVVGLGGSTISDRQLLARVYYNLGIDYANRAKYAVAASLTRTGWELDPGHDAARENWLATLNNWSLALIQQGDVQQARKVIQRGLDADRHYLPLLRARAHLERLSRAAHGTP